MILPESLGLVGAYEPYSSSSTNAGDQAANAAYNKAASGGTAKEVAQSGAAAAVGSVCPPCAPVAYALVGELFSSVGTWSNNQAVQYRDVNAWMTKVLNEKQIAPARLLAEDNSWRHHWATSDAGKGASRPNPYARTGIAADAPPFFVAVGSGINISPAAVSYYRAHDFPRDNVSPSESAGEAATGALLEWCMQDFAAMVAFILHTRPAPPAGITGVIAAHPVVSAAAVGGAAFAAWHFGLITKAAEWLGGFL